jgi:hypothetical protein
MNRMNIHKTRTLHAANLTTMLRTFMAVMGEMFHRKRTGSDNHISKDHYRRITGILWDMLTQCYSLTMHQIPSLNPTSLLRGVVHKHGNSK